MEQIIKQNVLTAQEFEMLFRSVGWDAPSQEQITLALQHSIVTFSAYSGDTLIGMARLIGDYGMTWYLKDLAVSTQAQKSGAGTALMKAVEDYILSTIQPGWAVSLELISSKGKEPFLSASGCRHAPMNGTAAAC